MANRPRIFVVHVQHEIPYLDAKFCQIEFGVQYDGLPEISITTRRTGRAG